MCPLQVRRGSSTTLSHLQRLDRLIFAEEQEVANLLHAFYQVHPMAYDRHLITIHLVQGQFRLQPYRGEAQKYRIDNHYCDTVLYGQRREF
jgi:hypothetical protein